MPPTNQRNERLPSARTLDVKALGIDPFTADFEALSNALVQIDGERAIALAPDLRVHDVGPLIRPKLRAYMFGGQDRMRWCWQPDTGKPMFALLGTSLDVLARAVNARTTIAQVTQGPRYVWQALYGMAAMGPDGLWTEVRTTRTVDLRDGSPEALAAMGRSANEAALAKARTAGAQQAESKARNRAIRKLLGVRGTYPIEQIDLPFVLVAYVFDPSGDPALEREYRRMQAQVAAGIAAPAAGQAVAVGQTVVDDGDDEEADLPAGASTAPAPAEREQRQQARQDTRRDEPAHDDHGEEPQPQCAVCRKTISPNVHDFSVRKYKRPLCLDHQREGDGGQRNDGPRNGGGQANQGRRGGVR